MTFQKMLFFVAGVLFSFGLQAQVLKPILDPNQKTLPVNREEGNIVCGQIVDRLERFRDMEREHNQGVAGFLGEVVTKVGSWYEVLSPLEGTAQNIPVGTFTPVQEGSSKIDQISSLAYENADLLANEMERILQSLRACKISE